MDIVFGVVLLILALGVALLFVCVDAQAEEMDDLRNRVASLEEQVREDEDED